MSIMELGALGEFVGAVGVVATLAYLAVQIRQNTLAMRGAALQTAYHDVRDNLNSLDTNLWRRFYDGEEVPPQDLSKIRQQLLNMMRGYETMWWQKSHRMIHQDMYNGYISAVRLTLARERSRRLWSDMKHRFHQGFVAEIDAYVEQEGGIDPYRPES
jgi:hypothetical protein